MQSTQREKTVWKGNGEEPIAVEVGIDGNTSLGCLLGFRIGVVWKDLSSSELELMPELIIYLEIILNCIFNPFLLHLVVEN